MKKKSHKLYALVVLVFCMLQIQKVSAFKDSTLPQKKTGIKRLYVSLQLGKGLSKLGKSVSGLLPNIIGTIYFPRPN